jgi:hypothetical protein
MQQLVQALVKFSRLTDGQITLSLKKIKLINAYVYFITKDPLLQQ